MAKISHKRHHAMQAGIKEPVLDLRKWLLENEERLNPETTALIDKMLVKMRDEQESLVAKALDLECS